MHNLKAIQSKAAIAAFIGDNEMWLEAMWQLRCHYVEKSK